MSEYPQGWPAPFLGSLHNDGALLSYTRAITNQSSDIPGKYVEFYNIVCEAEGHVQRRLEDRSWSRGAPEQEGVFDASWNNNQNINLYNVLNGCEYDSTESTPEAYQKRINELTVKLEVLRRKIQQMQAQPKKKYPELNVSWRQRQLIYQTAEVRCPYKRKVGDANKVVLTSQEVRLWAKSVARELEQKQGESNRRWGLCRDWAASLSNHLNNSFALEHYIVTGYQFNKEVMGCALQHTVNVVEEIEPLRYTMTFRFVIDAWKNPTVFCELNAWKTRTGYSR